MMQRRIGAWWLVLECRRLRFWFGNWVLTTRAWPEGRGRAAGTWGVGDILYNKGVELVSSVLGETV